MNEKYDLFENEIASLLEQLKSTETPDPDIWWEIWDTVHHQGDVWVSSYIAVPKIFEIYKQKGWLDYNLPGLLATIEICRQNDDNPELPDWLEKDYFQTLYQAVIYSAEKIAENWDRSLLTAFLQLAAAVKQNKEICELLEIASGSEYDTNYLLKLYNET